MFQKRLHLVSSFLALCVSILISFPLYNLLYLDYLAGTERCPQCYGQNMCSCLKHNFSLNWNYFWINLINSVSQRVIFGFCNDSSVVIKKFTIPTGYISLSKDGDTHKLTEVIRLVEKPLEDKSRQSFEFCPSLDKAESLYFWFREKSNSSFSKIEDSLEYKNLLHIIQVNVEPIIQQVGLAHEWAVSEYLGSCGDAVLSRYCGQSLTYVFPTLGWAERSSLAKQLLEFALNATFRHPEFAFYFTDMTPDNFAVSTDYIVRLVDLEHVIVVDKHPEDWPNGWHEPHKCYHDPTEQGFAFSSTEVCSHKTSDLNVYSICQGILSRDAEFLSGGLLHSPPPQKRRVAKLIQDCISPSSGQSRFDLALAIIEELSVPIT